MEVKDQDTSTTWEYCMNYPDQGNQILETSIFTKNGDDIEDSSELYFTNTKFELGPPSSKIFTLPDVCKKAVCAGSSSSKVSTKA